MRKKTTLKLAASLIGSALGADLICLIIFTVLSNWLNQAGVKAGYTIFSLLLLFWIVYATAWGEGNRDPNRVHYGHMEPFLVKGLVAGLIAEIPFALIALLFMTDQAAGWQNGWIRLIYYFLHIPYAVILSGLNTPIWLLAVLILPLPAMSSVSYLLGYHRISLMEKLVYQKKAPPARKK